MKLPTWEKKGLIFSRVNGSFFKSHAMRAVPFERKNGDLRLFISSRCAEDMMHPTFIDVDPASPSVVRRIGETPLLHLGRSGAFDDSGVTLGSVVRTESGDFAYYTGWKRRRYSVSFELSIGIARLLDDGDRMERLFEGPILAQSPFHPFLVGGPFVATTTDGRFRMWFCSATEWRHYTHGPEPIYSVYTAISNDGIAWEGFCRDPVIKYKFDGEVISAPWVVRLKSGYLMLYSWRGSRDSLAKRYQIGVATSSDGNIWSRRDMEPGIQRSEIGWDSEMICYPAVINSGDTTYMFYSGNGVGKGGIGYAVADEKLDIIDW
jgi:hypothetical protein